MATLFKLTVCAAACSAFAAAGLTDLEQARFNELLAKKGVLNVARRDAHRAANAKDTVAVRLSMGEHSVFDISDRLKAVEDGLKTVDLDSVIQSSITDALRDNTRINDLIRHQSDFQSGIVAGYVHSDVVKDFGSTIDAMTKELKEATETLTAEVAKAGKENKIALDKAAKDNVDSFKILSKKVTDEVVKAKKDITDEVESSIKGLDKIIPALKLTHYHNKQVPVFRYQKFHTHQGSGISWFDGNNANGYGGGSARPQQWTDANKHVNAMANDFKYLRRLFTRRGTANKYGANICSDTYIMYSSTTGLMCGVIFRIKNTRTSGSISWRPSWRTTSWSGWSEHSSVSMNGQNNYYSGGCANSCAPTVTLNIPSNGSGNRISTCIFMSSGTNDVSMGHNLHERAVLNHFRDNALALPSGLEYVDDMDTITGAWKQ